MAQSKVTQPRVVALQNGNPNAQVNNSVFQKVTTERLANTPIKSPTWPRHGTETQGQMARLLRGKLPR